MNNCCICFNNDGNLLEINQIVANNDISFKTELELLVPEVNWLAHYVVCTKCRDNLNLIQQFRQQCLKSQIIREIEIKVEEPTLTDCPGTQNSNKILLDALLKPDTTLLNNSRKSVAKADSDQLVLDPNSSSIFGEHICKYCNKIFRAKNNLKVHEKIHLNNLEYNCGKCEKRFNTSKNLSNHNLTEHTDPIEWRFHCELCDKRFPIKGNYDIHMKRHQNIKDFKCHLCAKEFRIKTSLKQHLTVHLNLKQFKCDLCDREYNLKQSLVEHKFKKHQIGNFKVKVKERKYVCEICGRAFAMLIHLKNHFYVHSDEQQFKCNLCGTKFKHKHSAETHMVKFHQKN